MSNGSKHHAPCIDLKHSPLTSCEHFFCIFFLRDLGLLRNGIFEGCVCHHFGPVFRYGVCIIYWETRGVSQTIRNLVHWCYFSDRFHLITANVIREQITGRNLIFLSDVNHALVMLGTMKYYHKNNVPDQGKLLPTKMTNHDHLL